VAPHTLFFFYASRFRPFLIIEGRAGLHSWNHGQCCCAGSRIFVQAGVYDEFLKRFTAKSKSIQLGDPFAKKTDQGPQVSKIQYDVRPSPSPLPASSSNDFF
jgi:acyl-CoA reductase-like NAD-dependent aldehyde dehydrogenase